MSDAPFPRDSSSQASGVKRKGDSQDVAPTGGLAMDVDEGIFGSSAKRAKRIEVVPDKKKGKDGKKGKKVSAVSVAAAAGDSNVGLGMVRSEDGKLQRIDMMKHSVYVPGAQALGYVLQITSHQVVVSLPGGLTGTVPAHEISDHMHRLHSALSSKGRGEKAEKLVEPSKLLVQYQQVHCVVLENASPVRDGTKSKRNIVLSLRASLVNKGLAFKHLSEGFPLYGCIVSKEDHGYIVSSGYSAINVFLPSKSVPATLGELVIGSPVVCVVASLNEGSRTAVVKVAPKAVTNARVTNAALPFTAIVPGALLDVIIEKVVQNGLVVRYLNSFRGAIDSFSLPFSAQPDGEWQSAFSEGSVLQARVVFVDHGSKSARLSLCPHVLQCRAPQHLPPLGSSLSDLRVVNVRKKVGVLLAKEAEEGAGAPYGVFIHKSDLEDPEEGGPVTVERIDKAYRAGRDVPEVRVRGYHLVEGWVLASNLQKYISSQVVHKSHVKVGQSLAVEVAALGGSALLLTVAGSAVAAQCPLAHLSDVGLSSLASGKFKVGQKMTMKVWAVSSGGSTIVMTHKKSLLDLDVASQLQSYSGAVIGEAYTGVVESAGPQGLRVAFFGGVVGTAPMTVLVRQGVPDAAEAYRAGQVVRCVVLHRSEGKKPKLTLGLDIGKRKDLVESYAREKNGAKGGADSAGSSGRALVSGVVTKVSEELVALRLDDGRVAHLHMLQCYDFAKTAVAVFNSTDNPFKEGARVEGALVLSVMKNIVNLTLKPLLLASHGGAAEDTIVPESLSELLPGQVLAGYVHKVEAYGVLVRFRGGLAALAPRPNIGDKFIATPEGLYSAGDSVKCVVQSTDAARERAIVSLKPRSLDCSQDAGACFLEALLRERHLAASLGAGALPDLKKFAIGSFCGATVSAIEKDHAMLTASDGSTKIKVPLALVAKPLKKGAAVRARLLDVEYAERVLLGSLSDNALAGSSTKKGSKQSAAPTPCVALEGTVEMLRGAYAVVASGGRVAYVQVADFHCPFVDASADLTVGSPLSGRVLRCGAADPHGGVVLLTASAASSGRAAISAPAQTKQKFLENLHVGAIMKWVVAEVGAQELKVQPQGHEDFGFVVQASIPLCAAVGHRDASDDLVSALQRAAKSGVGGSEAVHALHPFHGISAGQVVTGRVLQFRKKEGSSEDLVVFVSLDGKAAGKAAPAEDHSYKLLQWSGKHAAKAGSVHAGVVTKVEPTSCTVQLSPYISSRLSYMDVSGDASVVKAFKRSCYVGLRVVVAIVTAGGADGSKRSVKLSRAYAEEVASGRSSLDLTQLLPEELASPPAELKKGDIVMGMLDLRSAWTPRPPALLVCLPGGKQGRVCVTEVADPSAWRDLSGFFKAKRETEAQADSCFPYDFTSGSVVKCRVLEAAGDAVELSLRPSRVSKKGSGAEDPMSEEGDVVSAYVTNTDSKGCFLRLGRSLSGRALMKDLSDEYVADPAAALPAGALVQAKLLRLNAQTRQADLSLRASAIAGDRRAAAELEALVVGDTVRGTVQRVTQIGVFVALEGTSIVGLARRAAAAAAPNVEDLGSLFEEGDVVRAKVLSVAKASKKVALGLKPSYFSKDNTGEDEENDDDDDDDEEDDEEEEDSEDEEEEEEEEEDSEDEDEEDSGDEDEDEGITMLGEDDGSDDSEMEAMIQGSLLPFDDDEDEEEEEEEEAPKPSKKAKKAPQKEESDDESESDAEQPQGPLGQRAATAATGLFSWSDFRPAPAAAADSDSDSDNENVEEAGLKRKRSKDSKRALEEQQVHAKEMAIWEGRDRPESTQDFERLLLEDPDSSVTWIQYMALHLSNVEVDGARSVAERALKKINFRREDDKFNVWIAYLNLEKQFGSPASFDAVFKRAAVESKGKYVHLKVCQILEDAGELDAAADMYERTLKKFKYSKKVWMAFQHFRLRQQQPSEAKELLSRSMQSLSKHKHVEVITKYALAEFESGSADRARVVLEELLSNYPKRTDLWHVYIDKEIKMQNLAQARNLFHRMTTLKTSAKNIKNIFKKFVAFEQKYGSEATVNEVKMKARDYVNSMMA